MSNNNNNNNNINNNNINRIPLQTEFLPGQPINLTEERIRQCIPNIDQIRGFVTSKCRKRILGIQNADAWKYNPNKLRLEKIQELCAIPKTSKHDFSLFWELIVLFLEDKIFLIKKSSVICVWIDEIFDALSTKISDCRNNLKELIGEGIVLLIVDIECFEH